MTRHRIYFKSVNISPLAILGLGLLALAAFFLMLPLFLAALVVFGVLAGYTAWRIRMAMRRIEENRTLTRERPNRFTGPIIDLTARKRPSKSSETDDS